MFDYYAATCHAEPMFLATLFEQGDFEAIERREHGWKQYQNGYRCPTLQADVWFGGCNPHPHVRVAGEASGQVSRLLRNENVIHTVSRVDSRIDFCEPGAWTRTRQYLEDLACAYRLGTRLIVSPTDGWKGETLYLGSRKSPYFLRAYEKGKQLGEKGFTIRNDENGRPILGQGWHVEAGHDVFPDRNWIRVEVEYKPHTRPEKASAASMMPSDVWRGRRWTLDVYKRLTGLMETYEPGFRKGGADPIASLRHMTAQYTAAMRRAMIQAGVRPVRKHFAEWLDFCERSKDD